VVSVVEGDVDSALGSGEEEAFPLGIFATVLTGSLSGRPVTIFCQVLPPSWVR